MVTGDTSVNGILAPVEPLAVTNTLLGPDEIRSTAVCKHAGGYTVTLEAMCVPPDVIFEVNAQIRFEPPP